MGYAVCTEVEENLTTPIFTSRVSGNKMEAVTSN